MQTKYGFTLMTIEEFEKWIRSVKITRNIKYIQEHETFSPDYSNFNGSNHFSLQQGMKNYHVNSCGYIDIAQNLTTFPDGTIMTGRSLNTSPAGMVGFNSNGICIENLGNFEKGEDQMTQKQKDTIVRATAALLKKLGLSPENNVVYHGWATASGTYLGTYIPGRSCKTCPGTNFFGGNTRASYDKNLKPLIKQAMNGTYEGMDDEVITQINVFNCGTGKDVKVDVIDKKEPGGSNNFIRMQHLKQLGAKVGYGNGRPSVDLAPAQETTLVLNGENIETEAVFTRGTNYIPVRAALENLGVPHDDILWDEATRTITVRGKLEVKYTSATELADSENK